MFERIKKAKLSHFQVWVLSIGLIGFALGIYAAKYIEPYAEYILLIGLGINLTAMYKIFSKKKLF